MSIEIPSKTCTKCGESKPTTEFPSAGQVSKKTGRMRVRSECKLCYNLWLASKRPSRAKPDRRKPVTTAEKREKNRQFLVDYLASHPCVDCGISDIRVLEFDHVRGEKAGNISNIWRSRPLGDLVAEVEKCDVRCANCHRIVTMERAGTHRHLEWLALQGR